MPNSKRTKTDDAAHETAASRFAQRKLAPLNFIPKEKILLPSIKAGLEVDEPDDIEGVRSDQDTMPNDLTRSSDDLTPGSPRFKSPDSRPTLGGTDSDADYEGFYKTYRRHFELSLTSAETSFSNVIRRPQSRVDDHSSPDLVLSDVSFDNLIGIRGLTSAYYEPYGAIHRSKQALIKPDQVSRLPHLDPARKEVLSDQVVAHYYRLDRHHPGDKDYMIQLEKLEALSRLLMKGLKKWQQERSRAPNIPFSLN